MKTGAIVALILFCLLAGIFWLYQPDPLEKKVRHLVAQLSPSGSPSPEITLELVQLDQQAAPYLREILTQRDSKVEKFYDRARLESPQWLQSVLPKRTSKDDLRRRVEKAAWDLGPVVRRFPGAIVEALNNSEGREGVELLRSLYWSIPDSPTAVQGLRAYLKERPESGNLFGMSEAEEIWSEVPEFAPLLKEWLKNPQEAGNAAEALGLMGNHGAEAIPELLAVARNGILASSSKNRWTLVQSQRKSRLMVNQEYAIEALGRLGQPTPEVLDVLGEALGHSNGVIQAHAADSVGLLGPQAISLLPELLDHLNESNPKVLRYQLHALGNLGPQASRAIPVLKRWARPERHGISIPEEKGLSRIIRRDQRLPSIPVTAAVALFRIEENSMHSLLDILAEGLSEKLPDAMLEDLQSAAPPIIEVAEHGLNEGDIGERSLLAYQILRLEPAHESARQLLEKTMLEGGPFRQSVAARYYYRATGETNLVLKAFKQALESVAQEPNQIPVRSVAVLGKHAKPLVSKIVPLLKSQDPYVRKLAGKALRAIDTTALPQVRN